MCLRCRIANDFCIPLPCLDVQGKRPDAAAAALKLVDTVGWATRRIPMSACIHENFKVKTVARGGCCTVLLCSCGLVLGLGLMVHPFASVRNHVFLSHGFKQLPMLNGLQCRKDMPTTPVWRSALSPNLRSQLAKTRAHAGAERGEVWRSRDEC